MKLVADVARADIEHCTDSHKLFLGMLPFMQVEGSDACARTLLCFGGEKAVADLRAKRGDPAALHVCIRWCLAPLGVGKPILLGSGGPVESSSIHSINALD